jgi:hypothetical protein
MEHVVVMVARIPEHGIDAFARYEDAVLPLLNDHGGELQRRLSSDDGTTEVHMVAFPSPEAFAGYRSDPRRAEHAELLSSSDAAVEVFELRDAARSGCVQEPQLDVDIDLGPSAVGNDQEADVQVRGGGSQDQSVG